MAESDLLEAAHVVDIAAVQAPSFGLADRLPALRGDWHAHRRHQLLYAASGRLHLETAAASWVLPPQRAAWIRGGTRHRVDVPHHCALRTVYVDPAAVALPWPCRVFAVGPLAQAMLPAATRWGPDGVDDVGAAFLVALAGLAREWAEAGQDLRLPRARSPELSRALAWTRSHLDTATVAGAARAGGMSTRTLARRVKAETGESWRSYLHAARMLEAMALLEDGHAVGDVAVMLGYRSLGSFSRLFSAWAGESPRDWRLRARAAGSTAGGV